MTAELAGILGIAEEDLPPILRGRMPMPLKIGIHGDLLARYPNADTDATRRWLGQWVRTEQYLAQLAAGGNRYGLDGAPSGEVTEKASKAARDQLERLNSKKPSGIAV